MISRSPLTALVLLITTFTGLLPLARGDQAIQLIGYTDFTSFSRVTNQDGSLTLSSPELRLLLPWDQLVPSWNLRNPGNCSLELTALALYEDGTESPFSLGNWNLLPGKHAGRQSPRAERGSRGRVATDTVILNQPAAGVQLVLRFSQPAAAHGLSFLGISLLNTRVPFPILEPNREAWGRELAVPERSQMPYPDGVMLCSPAAVSMLTGFWAWHQGRPDWNLRVPDIADHVWDRNWSGTGNWSFNMAYVGAQPGLRAYVARFSDLSEVEDWLMAGVPVALSVCYNKLRGKPGAPSGHLVVCTGFTARGDVIVNDPGTTFNVRKVYPRGNVLNAWDNSRRTVYLIYPEGVRAPENKFGHWYGPDPVARN